MKKIKSFILEKMCSRTFKIWHYGLFLVIAGVNMVEQFPGPVRVTLSILLVAGFITQAVIMWATKTENYFMSENPAV